MVLDTAKNAGPSGEQLLEVEVAALAGVFVDALLVLFGEHPDRITEIAARAQVAPAEAEAEVEVVPTLVGDKILAAEQAGTAEVSKAERDFRGIGTLVEKREFYVDAFIQVVTIARDGTPVQPVTNLGVTKTRFHPFEGLEAEPVMGIGVDFTIGEGKAPHRGHTGSGGFQQTDTAIIGLEHRRDVAVRHIRLFGTDVCRRQANQQRAAQRANVLPQATDLLQLMTHCTPPACASRISEQFSPEGACASISAMVLRIQGKASPPRGSGNTTRAPGSSAVSVLLKAAWP